MANNRTLTTANAIIIMNVPGVITGHQVQGFSADDIFDFETVQRAEILMGLDGQQAGGYTPQSTKWTINLAANSESNDAFDAWISSQNAEKEIFTAEYIITSKSLGKTAYMHRGILESAQPFASFKKTAQPRPFVISFESVEVHDL